MKCFTCLPPLLGNDVVKNPVTRIKCLQLLFLQTTDLFNFVSWAIIHIDMSTKPATSQSQYMFISWLDLWCDAKPAIAVWGSAAVTGLTSKVWYYWRFLRRAQDNFKFCLWQQNTHILMGTQACLRQRKQVFWTKPRYFHNHWFGYQNLTRA